MMLANVMVIPICYWNMRTKRIKDFCILGCSWKTQFYTEKVAAGIQFGEVDEEERFQEAPTGTQ